MPQEMSSSFCLTVASGISDTFWRMDFSAQNYLLDNLSPLKSVGKKQKKKADENTKNNTKNGDL